MAEVQPQDEYICVICNHQNSTSPNSCDLLNNYCIGFPVCCSNVMAFTNKALQYLYWNWITADNYKCICLEVSLMCCEIRNDKVNQLYFVFSNVKDHFLWWQSSSIAECVNSDHSLITSATGRFLGTALYVSVNAHKNI